MKEKQEQEELEKETEDEESDLEEDLEEAELEIQEDKFVEFMTPSDESSSISLGQIAVATELRATDLERDLSEAPINNGNTENKDEFKYNIGSNSEEEAKYISSGEKIERTNMPSNVDIMSLGKKPNLLPPEVGFSASPSTQITEPGPEKYELPDKFDIDKAGKGKLFERPNIEYKSSNEY